MAWHGWLGMDEVYALKLAGVMVACGRKGRAMVIFLGVAAW